MAGEKLARHSFKVTRESLVLLKKGLSEQKEALDAGDALQICEYLLDLHQPFSERGHREDRQLITRIDRQNSQEPPAASWSIRCHLENEKH